MSTRRFSALALFLAVFALPRMLSAQQYYTCMFRTGLPGAAKAEVFATRTLPLNANMQDVNAAWKSYTVSQYPGQRGQAECFNGTTRQSVDVTRTAMEQAHSRTATDVDWVYDASMTALPSKPGAVYAFCMSGDFGGNTVYETPVFEIPMDDARSTTSPVEATFAKYLETHYPKKTRQPYWQTYSLGCPHSAGNRAETEAHRQDMEKQARAGGKSLVTLNWTYKRNADTPPANPNTGK